MAKRKSSQNMRNLNDSLEIQSSQGSEKLGGGGEGSKKSY